MSHIEVNARNQLYDAILAAVVVLTGAEPILAQVALDGTLGRAGSLDGPAYHIPADLGRQMGPNLFHSFSQFNLASGESATFTGPADVRNVLSRVTGAEPSSINGLIRSTIPGANFYLLNPNGVLFGPDARIDVGGAFVASTAIRLDLEDGGTFATAAPENSILTVAPPSAFGFLNAAPVSVEGSRLDTQPGQGLTLAGGNVTIDNASLSAPGGQINLMAVGSSYDGTVTHSSAAASVQPLGGEVRLGGLTTVDTSGAAGGQVRIRGGRLVMEGPNILSGPRILSSGQPDVPAIEATLTESVRLSRWSQIVSKASESEAGGDIRIETPLLELSERSAVRSETSGATAGGDLMVTVERVRLTDDSALATMTFGTGDGGDLHLKATTIELDHGGKVLSGVESPGLGRGGDMHIQTTTLRVTDNSEMVAYTDSQGPGGDLHIQADLVEVSSKVLTGRLLTESVIGTTAGYRPVPIAEPVGTGSGGDLYLHARTITLTEGGLLRAQSGHSGQGGDAFITADEIYIASTAPSSTGIRVEGRRLRVDPNDRRDYFNSTGSLHLQAGLLTIQGGGEVSLLHWSTSGQAGTLNIQAGRIHVTGLPGARPTIYPAYQIYTMFWELYARDEIVGGAAHIQADEIHLSNGAKIGSFYRAQNLTPRQTLAPGGTGAPFTLGANRVTVSGPGTAIQSYLASAPLLESKGGELHVSAHVIKVENGGTIATYADSTEAFGLRVAPHAGTLRVDANQLTVTGYAGTPGESDYAPSRIISRHPPGNSSNSGDMWISARQIELSHGAEIAAQGTYVPAHPTGLNLQADIIRLEQGARIWTSGHVGYGLNIHAANTIMISSGSQIVAETFTTTDREVLHRIQIDAPRILITGGGSGIYPISRYDYAGIDARANEGDLQIRTEELTIQDGAVIDSQAKFSTADGGIILIQGLEAGQPASKVRIAGPGSGIFTGTREAERPGFTPEAGRITINARQLAITDQAAITTTADGRLAGGDVFLNGGVIEISRGGLIASAASGSGSGGNIFIDAHQVKLSDRARLVATSSTPGDGEGAAGDIVIRTSGQLLVQNDSDITTEAGLGRGGNIKIESAYVVLSQSRLSANTAVGHGGSVELIAKGIFQSDSLLSATSGIGLHGRVTVLAPDLDVTGTITPLTVSLVEGETYLPEHCARKLPGPVSSFVVLGQGGIPLDPDGWQPTFSGLATIPVASTLSVLGPIEEPILPATASVTPSDP